MLFTCNSCGKTFHHKGDFNRHCASAVHERKRKLPPTPITVKKARTAQPTASDDFSIRLIHRGFMGLFKIYRASFKRVYNDISMLTTMLLAHIVYLLEQAVIDTNGIKAHLRCTVIFHKATETTKTMPAYFISKPAIYLHTTNVAQQYSAAMADIHRQIQDFIRLGSGWVVQRIEHADVYVSKYTPIRGKTYCKLPPELARKKAIINVVNKDDRCFMWSVMAALYPKPAHAERVAKYKDDLRDDDCPNFDDTEFPVALGDIPNFESQNNLGINVLGYGDAGLFPLYSTKTRGVQVINLLLLAPEDGPAHYCLIKDLGKLLFTATGHKEKKHICNYCLCPFNTPERLVKHLEFCTFDRQKMKMPKNPVLKFRNVQRQLRAPYVLYADCETFPEPQPDGRKKHVPNSYGLLGVKRCCQNSPQFDEPVVYRGPEPIQHFLDTLIAKGEAYIQACDAPMNITPDQQAAHDCAQHCYLCRGPLGDAQVHRDHCHVCREYRGATHADCNLTARHKKEVTVLFHNLRKYDGHLVMQQIGTVLQKRKLRLECVARGVEDYMSFVVKLKSGGIFWSLRFVDSLAFLPASLDTLAKNLPKDKLIALRRFTKHPDLLSQKGFYPYDKITGPEHFSYPGIFPISDFYNSLKNEPLSADNYQHVLRVFEAHGFQRFGEYHDLYLLVDVLLLADVFENFRDFALATYGLDPVHYITLPSFSWDALLKFTGAKLELLDDPDMYHVFSAGIRGGVSTITHRYAKANNPYIPETFNPDEPTSYIMYLDANNLYGWAMKQPLPVGGFQWVGEMDELPTDDGYGYILEVDLEYPSELHETHNDYPLAPEPIVPPYLSKYCAELRDKLSDISDVEYTKLIPNLMDKEHYIIHHRALQQCLDLGLKLKKIHRGIRFREKSWMAPYIDFNTEMRKNAANAFEKDLFKLLNNAVYGKSMENVFNYISVVLTIDPKKYEKLVGTPLYKHSRHFDNELHAVLMKREEVELCKPIYTGFSVLELSKTLMYDFHYSYIRPKYGSAARLLFTDTDSLCYRIYTPDVYTDMLADRHTHFDTSDYPKDHPLHSDLNKKVIGLMKDETGGTPIKEFVGLRSKMYSILLPEEEKKRAKGINKSVVERDITHEDYRNTLFQGSQMSHAVTQFRSSDHIIFTVTGEKTSLSAFDDKRYILDDGVETLAYGHRDIDPLDSIDMTCVS